MSAKVRINRFLASAGFGSRRRCEQMIRQRRVAVNGRVLEKLAELVDPDADEIAIDGKPVRLTMRRKQVIVLNKPTGVLSTVSDSFNRRTVIDIARELGYAERLFPVGRLDLDTSGILLLTNDGDFSYRLTHPRYKIEKSYRVTVAGQVDDRTIARIGDGVELGSYRTKPCRIEVLRRGGGTTMLAMHLHEGRKRQIRRTLALFGHSVIALERTALGGLAFEDLAPGAMRALSTSEERRLRELAGLNEEGEE